jgi:hypothetical protein
MKRLLRALVLLASTTAVGGPAMAVTPPEEPTPSPSTPTDPADRADAIGVDQADEHGSALEEPGTPPAVPRATSISLSGGLKCLLLSRGEASTTWRHGRQKSGRSISEIMHRMTVAGVATCAGRTVEFSAAVVVPALRIGAYTLKAAGIVSLWARSDRTVARPDIEWDAGAHGGGPASLTLTVASITETTRRYEWRDGVALDVRNFEIQGAIQATVPCARSIPALRRSCLAETIAGTF